jgi:ribosome biogenesis protein SSF1/2
MAKKRAKRRTHNKGDPNEAQRASDRTPKSMVVRIGASEVGPSISQLVKDFRSIMEPNTASRLKERKANKLRDYTTMCGPLGVSHLLLFTRSGAGNTNFRVARTPRGPTLSFQVEKYSLTKDVQKSQRHARTGGYDFQTAPLLVMNNFITPDGQELHPNVPKHLERLVTDVFQGMFPAISPQTTPLSSIRRVLLLNREKADDSQGSYIVNLRHYAITTKVTGLPKAIRRLNAAEKMIASKEKKKSALPNLGNLEDVADYMMDPTGAGYTSASESEVETEAEVEVLANTSRKVLDRKALQQRKSKEANGESRSRRPNVEKRAVKLTELGPRMRLRLVKVEDQLCAGKVLWHEFIHKSQDEVKDMDRIWEHRRKEKEERRRIQRENVERKKKENGIAENGDAEDEDDEMDEELEDYDMDDDVWDGEEADNAANGAHQDEDMVDDDGGDEEMSDEG